MRSIAVSAGSSVVHALVHTSPLVARAINIACRVTCCLVNLHSLPSEERLPVLHRAVCFDPVDPAASGDVAPYRKRSFLRNYSCPPNTRSSPPQISSPPSHLQCTGTAEFFWGMELYTGDQGLRDILGAS